MKCTIVDSFKQTSCVHAFQTASTTNLFNNCRFQMFYSQFFFPFWFAIRSYSFSCQLLHIWHDVMRFTSLLNVKWMWIGERMDFVWLLKGRMPCLRTDNSGNKVLTENHMNLIPHSKQFDFGYRNGQRGKKKEEK